MQCPVCKSYANQEIDLHSEQFTEEIVKCEVCDCEWAVNHGLIEIVKDSQINSFLESTTECVEGDDYNYAAA